MIYLLLSILSSIGIFLAFRLFKTYDVHTRHGIMINYLVAGFSGLLFFLPDATWFSEAWFLPSTLLGVLFYVVFRIMAQVTQQNGLAVSSIATKMSVVIPISIGLTLLNESLTALKLLAIALGLIAVVLSSTGQVRQGSWLWPLLLFLGSGCVDSSLKLFQHYLVSDASIGIFSSNVFLSAFVTAGIHHSFTKERRIHWNAIAGGTALGLVNVLALFFILKALAMPGWESSVVFPINNFGIIAGSTLMAIFLFKERLSTKGWIGFVFAMASIIALYFTQ